MSLLKLIFNVLYPAYATFKAFRSKNVHEYVKWMMYWIVFALFTFFETFADVLFFWLPFYDELKILMLLWLIVPVWKDSLGSGLLYKKLVHPFLVAKEPQIDDFVRKLKKQAVNVVTKFLYRLWRSVTNYVSEHVVAAFITPELAPPEAVQVFSSDSEAETPSRKPAKKLLRKKKMKKN
jgi:receptor expression-enhancing protein 1/2/3/4